MRRLALLPLSLLLACAPIAFGEDEGPPKLSGRYEKAAQLEVKVPEISGMTALPSDDASQRAFLVVSDDGRCRLDAKVVENGLFRVVFSVEDGGSVEVAEIVPIALHLRDQVKSIDPVFAKLGGWTPDLESCVPLPGTDDLFLLGAERGAEDAYDGGANRLYVVQYPAGDAGRAEVKAYVRIPDQVDDTINDRLEGVVALDGGAPDTWLVFAFKERTAMEGGIPAYFPFVMKRTEDGFTIAAPALQGRRRLPTLIDDRERLGSQADACVASDGSVWVLDRWRREIHLARAADGLLRHEETLDYFDLVKDVPEETGTSEPAAPGGAHPGYGRHEAICFDAQGWLWLGADLGGGNPSVVTALRRKEHGAKDDG